MNLSFAMENQEQILLSELSNSLITGQISFNDVLNRLRVEDERVNIELVCQLLSAFDPATNTCVLHELVIRDSILNIRQILIFLRKEHEDLIQTLFNLKDCTEKTVFDLMRESSNPKMRSLALAYEPENILTRFIRVVLTPCCPKFVY